MSDFNVTRWPSPAKLNLILRITGPRPDGYHELQTMFQLLDYGDDIDIAATTDGVIETKTAVPGVNQENDLCVLAARLLKRETGTHQGAVISLQKRLPIGAGLGGGSSNAATVLIALNRIWGTGLSLQELATLGLQLGADVPVFVMGKSAWAEGVGERLVPTALPERWFLVISPGVHVKTSDVFRDARLTRNCPPITIRAFLDQYLNEPVDNVCQPIVRERYPGITEAIDWLAEQCHGRTRVVGMTGTGSCVFAAFESRSDAQNLLHSVPEKWRGFVAKGVDVSPLHRVMSPE
ncbi:MAG: 4-(cytidine 5'-diphospho)-2-C-methyl-D-erythritol kinase [Pseudomonadota bacterium]